MSTLHQELTAALRDCAEELAAEIEARYPTHPDGQRYLERRYERDMHAVYVARQLLARLRNASE